jgi:hypothetical protein
MENIPNIISTKDFAYLTDMFSWNYTAIKQMHHMLKHSDNEELNVILSDCMDTHIYNCNKILEILKLRGEDNE